MIKSDEMSSFAIRSSFIIRVDNFARLHIIYSDNCIADKCWNAFFFYDSVLIADLRRGAAKTLN